jgi:N-methylhydantoinase A/acetophenone carboxylase
VFNSTVAELVAKAKQELLSEGLPVEEAVFSLELDMLYGGQVNVKRMSAPVLTIASDEDAQLIYDAFEAEFSAAFSPLVVNRPGGVYLDNFVLRAMVPTVKPTLPEYDLQGADPASARLGQRNAYWPQLRRVEETPVFSFERLMPGNSIAGPAIIEAELTTIVIPPGNRFSLDKHGFGILESAEVDTSRAVEAAAGLEFTQ